MAKTLQLHFTTADDKKLMLTVDAPRDDLTAQTITAAMQDVIDSGIFHVHDLPLAYIGSAQIVDRTVTKIVEG